MKDYYKILGVERNASEDEIKKQYRRLAKKYHPDVSTEAEATQKFQELQEAYSILKDPQKKAQYDMGGSAANGDRVRQYYSSNGGADPFMNIHDLFESLRGRQQRRTIYRTTISLEEAFHGTIRQVNDKSFRIPPGLRTGNRISVDDFWVDVVVLPHAKYKRAGDDLLVEANITAAEAMLGVKLDIDHIDRSHLRCDVPAGTQPGQILRLRGKGMPNPEVTNIRGDLLVQINISIPRNLTDEQKESIISLGYRNEIQV
jgi:curved DNA-binding protein